MDRKELARIYDLYFDTVYKVCFLYVKNHADAQDLTQEIFCQMLRKEILYISDEKTKAWLIVSASNLCKNQLKKWWVKKRVPYEDGLVTQYMNEQDKEVYDVVMGLEQKYAIPTYLYYYEGYKTAEIARLLKEKQSTIQTRLAKARELLKLELSE